MSNNSDQTNMVSLKWNDKEIKAKAGSNLLQAALDNGIEVAHYCYHQGLSVAGVCRMCMVEQEGVPRPFPACNATVAADQKVRNDTAKIKDAVEWTLQFHLVNHPLDCPICDQAGECGLQEYYMKHGQYDSSMVDQKVHKDKVQDIGRNVMLDAERCILCSRCTRFTAEVTKSHELGILQRGDHAEITVLEELKNDYAMNLVDICPVGALTSKDFRFQQRVWFLEDVVTTCIGCETGCSVKVSQNEGGAYRVKPVYDHEVNGHWMCDDGRDIYRHVSGPGRLQSAMENKHGLFIPIDETSLKKTLQTKTPKFILSASLTNEEYERFFARVGKASVALYSLPSMGEEFDGILKRSDKNANLRGAKKAFKAHGADSSNAALMELLQNLSASDAVYLVLPEIIYDMDHFKTLITQLKKASLLVALTPTDGIHALRDFHYLLPVPTFLEKTGSLINYQDKERNLSAGMNYGAIDKDVADYVAWALEKQQ